MKRVFLKIVALCLAVVLLFSGCNSLAFNTFLQAVGQTLLGGSYVAFADMEYVRPDLTEYQSLLDRCMDGAKTDTDVDELMEKVYAFYEAYYSYVTNYSLANIHYYLDMSDTYWQNEYTFCTENSSQIDAGLDNLFYALAKSSLKEQLEADEFFGDGFFDDYSGESIWDEQFTSMMEQQTKLQNQYDGLCAEAISQDPYSNKFYEGTGREMAEIFVDLVALRGEIARYAGYDNFLDFAYDFYYNRDYTPEQATSYTEDVQELLVELYLDIPSDAWDPMREKWSEKKMYSYVEECANAMGGTVADAFALMTEGGYYDISYSKNKYDASFEVFLPSYAVPFLFVNPTGTGRDPMTFAHEFGHFCNDYASVGRVGGIDVAEVFSQSMEYLSLFYGKDTEKLEKMKMADSLAVFVEQSAYASFENQVYLLDEKELTVENVQKLFAQVGDDFGFSQYGWDGRNFVHINHFFIAPVYIISYVVSNDAAMQIYQAEHKKEGAGLKLFEDNLASQEPTFLAFVKSAGLQSPFVEGRVEQLRETFEDVLG